jgi:hypothetical protein
MMKPVLVLNDALTNANYLDDCHQAFQTLARQQAQREEELAQL